MFSSAMTKIFGSKNKRELKRMRKVVTKINALEEDLSKLDDESLKAKSAEFKKRVGEGESLDQILPEAFAVCREAGKRVLSMRHFDVQLIGGMTLHEGRISEMRTGEGKTLVATLAVYLNALEGKGVHVVTVNDYLAKRDSKWMEPLYNFLGLSVGVVYGGQQPDEKRAAYQSDITYGTNNEFGFDYLRDNMAFNLEGKYQRGLNFAIVDEVDSILIDEARTPLVISGAVEDSSKRYKQINALVPMLKKAEVGEDDKPIDDGHFTIDEKSKNVDLTEAGHTYLEGLLIEHGVLEEGDSLYAATNLNILHHVYAALRAHYLYVKDVDYIVQNKQIVIIDEHTGRTMAGRRWGEGLHQAIEAKENVAIQAESQTLASTTFQNFFRIYSKLAGMTGTADTEAFEFQQIYGLDVVVIPTNKEIQRIDHNDLIYLTQEEKYQAIIDEVKAVVAQKRPILVGTASIESSEFLSALLKKAGIKHSVLNAKQHAQEAQIVAQAGLPGVVTIATNMAGRGTDIVLGGNWEAEIKALKDPSDDKIAKIKADWEVRNKAVLEAGGLHILGTERHESRRIDNQLRGRSGRQGDPGSTRFFLSLEDNLMRLFASDRVRNIMQALGMDKGEAIEHKMVSNAIEKAQRKVEGRNFDIRKSLLEYDDVANDQRSVIYEQRNSVMESDDISDIVAAIREEVVDDTISRFIPPQSLDEQWDIAGLESHLESEFAVKLPVQEWLDSDDSLHEETLRTKIIEEIVKVYKEKEETAGAQSMRNFEKQVFLHILDTLWKEHLASMDALRQGIHLRSYAQKNPKQEYKREAFVLFESMLGNLKNDVVRVTSHVKIQTQDEAEELERRRQQELEQQLGRAKTEHADANAAGSEGGSAPAAEEKQAPVTREGRKVGRNEPCPCGSGKKYKQCHGKVS
ncbi:MULTISPECIES: preprotein translocase subunit SecA [unclassified Oleiphilus]|jgi:preprotein translocase subunit SecA|nr:MULTISPECIES: preprotein translocase subunit SecA [unclassified Oleiphilus]KZY48027.1 preprotein translocase subunit SecA [Oleiphilus sp. HI0050]KZY75490.1 preprotein translocase subunit SecA [Oleiphilus sp. HI0069]KZZ33204.1 preprotein translocase subunit SecA [Oleiphilus sp. HI0085]KZY54657.1 preprotein translocase subunit SecA [Oleiphilus sp. HI0061]KZZ34724.1 preprotein translocase subunit SecA [Oleiphilus sp. HI0086]